MRTQTTIPITEARKRIFDIAEEVQKPGTYYILTEKGRPKAIMMSVDEFESLMETLEVMQEFPDLAKDAEEVEKAVKSGEYKKWTSLEDIMAEYGYVLADKSKKKYEVGSKTGKKGKKRTGKNS